MYVSIYAYVGMSVDMYEILQPMCGCLTVYVDVYAGTYMYVYV